MSIQRKSFTLIELLVTMAIFSVITVISYHALSASARNETVQGMHSEQLFQLQKTLNYLERDITQTSNQNINLSSSGLTIDTLQNDQLLTINYAISSNQLFRQDITNSSESKTLALLDNVKKATITILDDQNQWQMKWRKNDNNRAKAIEIKFSHPYWGNLNKLVMIDDD
jgi:general secretion pathway protein J|tara:strand:- start:241 stop:750 length:510 start_codon:yes stop_codon:yes gene_type:complete